jgi:hypothetical protein
MMRRTVVIVGSAVLAAAVVATGVLLALSGGGRTKSFAERGWPPRVAVTGLLPGSHMYTYAQATATGVPGVTRYDPQDDPAKCVPNAHWSCKGSAMYCSPEDYKNDGGYKSAAAAEAAIAKAPEGPVCTFDPRQTEYGYGSDQTYRPLNSTRVAGNRLRYRDPDYGWTISYPRAFDARAFTIQGFDVDQIGVSIANFSPPPNPDFQTTTYKPVHLPADSVVFQLTHYEGGLFRSGAASEPRFPLTLSDFTKTTGFSASRRTYEFQANGTGFHAVVSIGPKATSTNWQALATIVSSLRFPTLKPGTVTPSGYYVLQPPSAYPIGTVTRYDPAKSASGKQGQLQPFYLVHDVDGFRAVGWPSNMYPPRYKPPCNVRFDPKQFQFYCPNGPHWDSHGRDLAHLHKPRLYRPLYLYATSISQDDHVMVSENEMSSPH